MSIFYLSIKIVAIFCIAFCVLYATLCKSIISAVRRVLYILPYFLSVLIMQAITPRGEAYNVMGFFLDKQGIDTTLVYFLRFTTVLYFLGIVFRLLSRISLPQNKMGEEIVRLSVFFKILRKNFFRHIVPLKDKNISSGQKFVILKQIISSVYISTFKNYPYDKHVNMYYDRLRLSIK